MTMLISGKSNHSNHDITLLVISERYLHQIAEQHKKREDYLCEIVLKITYIQKWTQQVVIIYCLVVFYCMWLVAQTLMNKYSEDIAVLLLILLYWCS